MAKERMKQLDNDDARGREASYLVSPARKLFRGNLFLFLSLIRLRRKMKKTPSAVSRRKKKGLSATSGANRDDAAGGDSDGAIRVSKRFSSSSSKARKQKDLNAIGNVLKLALILVGIFLGVSIASVALKNTSPKHRWRGGETPSSPGEMKELEKAREMLRGRYEAAYEDIEHEFSVFSDDSQLQTYSDMFASMTERGRMEIWERATEKFYSRAEYDANGETERAKKQKEAHGTFAPEVSAKKQFAVDDPKRFGRLVELVRDKMENGPPKEKDDEMKTRAQTKRAARSAALTAFVFEVLQTLREEGSSYLEEAPRFDV